MYTRTNINTNSYREYLTTLRTVFLIILVLVFALAVFSYYNIYLLTSPVSFSLWFMSDLDIHFYLASFMLASTAFSALIDFFQSRVIQKTFEDSSCLDKDRSPSFAAHPTAANDKVLLYKLLTSTASSLRRPLPLASIFKDNKLFSTRWEGIETSALFKLVHANTSSSVGLGDLLNSLTTLGLVPKRLTATSPELAHLNFQPELPKTFKSFRGDSKSRVEYALWNLELLGREAASKGLYVHSADGLIYSTSNYSKASQYSLSDSASINVQDALKNQADTIKWGRWLYKYSILHRRLLTHLNKNVTAKGLIGTGFATSDLTSQNLWAASTFKKGGLDWDKISAAYKEIYGSYVDLAEHSSTAAALPTPTNGITSLNNDAASYNWFIKRFYGLNTLPVNTISLSSNLVTAANLTHSLSQVEDSSVRAAASSQTLEHHSVLYSDKVSRVEANGSGASSYYTAYGSPSMLQRSNIQTMVSLVRNNGDSGVKFFLLRPFN